MANRDYWSYVIDYIKTDPDLGEWVDSGDVASLKELDDDFIKAIKGAFSYQGFDPLKIIGLLRKEYNRFIETNQVENLDFHYTANGQDTLFEYTSHEAMSKDMQLVITIFVMRGSTWTKISAKANDGVDNIMQVLKAKYKFNDVVHDANTSLPPEMVTIPRVAGCFPYVTCMAYHKGLGRTLATHQDMGLDADQSRALLTPFFASCIPPAWIDVDNNVHLVMFIAHIVVDNIVHRKRQDYTPLDQMLSYYQAVYFSPAAPQQSRALFCRTVGVTNNAGNNFSANIMAANQTAEQKIRELRHDDPKLNDVIRELKALKVIG